MVRFISHDQGKKQSGLAVVTALSLILSGLVGVSAAVNADATAPGISSITPSTISETGDRTVSLGGTNLTSVTVVRVGGVDATAVTVIDANTLTFTAPSRYDIGFANSNSLVHSVTVFRDGVIASVESIELTYDDITTLPTVSSITPDTGPSAGGTAIAIAGTGFLPGRTSVTIGGAPATSVVVISSTSLTAVTPATSTATDVSTAVVVRVAGSLANLDSAGTPMFNYTVSPELTAVSPTSGTAAGGNVITITGKKLSSATAVRIDGVPVASFTVVSETSIDATVPVRADSSRTVGRKAIQVELEGGLLASGELFYTYRPSLVLNVGRTNQVVRLGDLASRTQGKPITRITDSPPFSVSGIDSITGLPYSYITDVALTGRTAYANESHEANPDQWTGKSTSFTGSVSTSASYSSRNSVFSLTSTGTCTSDNKVLVNGQEVDSYCTVFGPEVYSEAFYGKAGQALSFDWGAVKGSGGDDYELYAYLVKVEDSSVIPTPSSSNHTLLLHSMGRNQTWLTSSGNIDADGLYRFRFVNGSYDATGGKVWGSTMYIDPIVTVGTANVISFPSVGDKLTTGPSTFDIEIGSSSNSLVSVEASPSSVCTRTSALVGTKTIVTVTIVSAGTCTLTANQGASAGFAPASQVTRVFDIRANAVVPTAPVITSITPGAGELQVAFNPPSRDGGEAVTSYEYSLDNGVTWINASPPITASPFTVTGLDGDTTYQVRIRAVNSVGNSPASAAVSGKPTGESTPPPPTPQTPVSEPQPTASPTPDAPVRPAPRRTPTPTTSPTPLAAPVAPTPTPTPTASPTVVTPVLVPVAIPRLEPTPGVVFSPTNPIPIDLLQALFSPLAYTPPSGSGQPALPSLTPTESLANENGVPVAIELVRTAEENGYVLRGDGWEVALEATDSSGRPLNLNEAGNIILNQDRFVEFSGTGFAPGSVIKVWLFSDPTSLADVVADGNGNFVGKSLIPEGIPTGEHTIQLNGLTQDGQVRSVALGVLIQPELVVIPPAPDFGLLNWMLLALAALVGSALIWFILWRRRKKDENQEAGIDDVFSGLKPTTN